MEKLGSRCRWRGSIFFPLLFVAFAIYEFVEWGKKRDDIAGDFVEFFTGCGGVAMCWGLLSVTVIS